MKKAVLFAWVAFWVGGANAYVGRPYSTTPGTYEWWLPLMVLVVFGGTGLLGYQAGLAEKQSDQARLP